MCGRACVYAHLKNCRNYTALVCVCVCAITRMYSPTHTHATPHVRRNRTVRVQAVPHSHSPPHTHTTPHDTSLQPSRRALKHTTKVENCEVARCPLCSAPCPRAWRSLLSRQETSDARVEAWFSGSACSLLVGCGLRYTLWVTLS